MRLCALLLLSSLAATNAITPAAAAAAADSEPWEEILGPAQGTIPPPRPDLGISVELPTHRTQLARTGIRWETDLPEALRLAKAEDRPVFVTFRCLPCKSCSEFDKTVLEGGPDLDPLFRQFVTARLTSAKDVDLRLIPMASFQDLDVSWWSYFLSPDGRVYGVFGGRDKSGDQTRTSKAALVATMKRVLAHHYDPRRPAWDVDGPAPATAGPPQTPTDLPGFKSWLDIRRNGEQFKAQNCVHCHQTAEILRQGEMDAGRFDKARDLYVWPFPENVGVVVGTDDGLKVRRVIENSPAAAAGLRPGDVLAAAGERRLFSQADFRGVLHRAPIAGPTRVDVRWLRDGSVMAGTLGLPDGWRRADVSWRASVADGNVGAHPGFWPTDAGAWRDRLALPKGTMAVKPHFGFGKQPETPAQKAGLRATDVIVAVGGEKPDLANREWNAWFRNRYEPGDAVTLTVKNDKGEVRDVTYRPGK